MNAILGVYTELAEVTNLQCDYLELMEKCKGLETELLKSKMIQKIFYKERKQYFKIQDLKAQLQDKGIVISELKKLIEKLKGKYVDTKFEKSSVIRQPNAFKSQRPSVLGKLTTFSNSFVRKDFSKSMSVTQTNVSNDFSKPVTAQTLPLNKKSILKNTNVLAPRMYKLQTDHNQTRTSQLPQDSRNTSKRVSFSTEVIPTTSVSRLQLKSNPQGDRVMHNNSQGKKQTVEDQRRSVKLSMNKTSVTACNDSLNAKTLNVKSVSAMCDKCVLIDKHAICVLNSVAKPIKRTVALESNRKPRNFTRKLYERVSKTCSWWYFKFTPSGYTWKPKSRKKMRSTVSNTPLSSNSFAARRDCPIHRVIPTTSVSIPQRKSNPQGDRVLCSNSRGKKLEVEEHRRNVKLSKYKMSVTACNDSLNAKNLNAKSVFAMCDKCVMIDKHDLCVPNFVAKPLKKTVALESIKKPQNNKFLGTVKFGYDQIAPILGYGDLVQGAV
nr:hypothetical protein [Tanacetum cinerariifolium]